MRGSAADWQTSLQLRRISSLLWGKVVEAKLRDLDRAIKASFDPNQPRVAAGNPDGGQWTRVGSGGSATSDDQLTGSDSTDSLPGGTDDDQLGDPPRIPKERPQTSRGRTRVYKQLAVWLVNFTVRKRIAFLASLLDEAGWLEPAIESIRTFADPPKNLHELQQDVYTPAPGYDVHHIVEQTSAERDGFPRDMIDAPENLVRIPRLKHWIITGWFMTPNEEYGWESPRSHLHHKSWDERAEVGHKALIEFGVMKK